MHGSITGTGVWLRSNSICPSSWTAAFWALPPFCRVASVM